MQNMLLDLKKMNQTLDNMTLPNGTESKTESVQPKIDENDFFAAQSIERALLALPPIEIALPITYTANHHRKRFRLSSITFPNGKVPCPRYEWSEKRKARKKMVPTNTRVTLSSLGTFSFRPL